MTSSLLLDASTWDLTLDASGNIAVAQEPYSLAQDVASAIRTFLGECFWDTTIGVPYFQRIFGKTPAISYVKSKMVDAALTVAGVKSAQCFIVSFSERAMTIQVQIISQTTEELSAVTFTVINPQGVG